MFIPFLHFRTDWRLGVQKGNGCGRICKNWFGDSLLFLFWCVCVVGFMFSVAAGGVLVMIVWDGFVSD